MKRLAVLLSVLALLLCSCRPLEADRSEDTSNKDTSPAETIVTTAKDDTTKADTTKSEPSLPCLIGFYDDLSDNGTYTRLSDWNEPWVPGKDIAVFDVIPSSESTLMGSSYKKLWIGSSEKITSEGLVKPYFVLEYTLSDGTLKKVDISSYADAEKITDEGYLEVYLYDDIHQEDGVWYYHLTESTTNDETVISSFKLTAGKEIDSVKSITLSAYIEGSSGTTVEIRNGN